jgi:hemolysin activation/secretion protein
MLLETIGQLDARWYQQPTTDHTLVLAARGVAGNNVPRDFQVIVGGLNGLRAYPVAALAGTRVWRLNAEDRWTVGERFWESVTLGAVAFVDAARAWGPGSDGSDWYVDAGTGVRISLPQWSLGQALRIDLAWPIQPARDGGHRAVLTFGSSQAF